jgi:23S rRNA (adenine-N6)-dimethyltransferase
MKRQNKGHQRIRKYKQVPNFLGQHFLHNKGIIYQLIEKADLTSTDTVLDIGAGNGALTLPLAEKAGKVIAVEVDPQYVRKLKEKTVNKRHVTIIEKDFLQMKLPKNPFCVVSSIPYAITTPILGKMLDQPQTPLERAVFVIEKGAAKRFTKQELTDPRILKWRMWFTLKMGRTISATQFSPPPGVDSAVLTVCRKKQPEIAVHHHARFTGLADYGLRNPHLDLREAFRGVFTPPQIKHLLHNLGVDRHTPIGLLNERHWGIVFQALLQYVPPFRWPKTKQYTHNY